MRSGVASSTTFNSSRLSHPGTVASRSVEPSLSSKTEEQSVLYAGAGCLQIKRTRPFRYTRPTAKHVRQATALSTSCPATHRPRAAPNPNTTFRSTWISTGFDRRRSSARNARRKNGRSTRARSARNSPRPNVQHAPAKEKKLESDAVTKDSLIATRWTATTAGARTTIVLTKA